jgi:hypothetical protein
MRIEYEYAYSKKNEHHTQLSIIIDYLAQLNTQLFIIDNFFD